MVTLLVSGLKFQFIYIGYISVTIWLPSEPYHNHTLNISLQNNYSQLPPGYNLKYHYRCNTDISPSDGLYLHVGGVDDAFSIPEGRLNSYDFIGSIATVVVDGVQLDLTCPSNERNTLLGSYLSAYCDTDPCNEHSSCVSYTNVPLCQCIGGFGSDSCDEETGNLW